MDGFQNLLPASASIGTWLILAGCGMAFLAVGISLLKPWRQQRQEQRARERGD